MDILQELHNRQSDRAEAGTVRNDAWIQVEDEADAAITFENGAVYAFYACNYYVKNSPIRVEISGEKGRCLLKEMEMEIELDGQAPYKILPQAQGNGGEGYWGSYHSVQVRQFYEKLAADEPVCVDAADELVKEPTLFLMFYVKRKK